VLFREDADMDDLIDVIEGNRRYIRCLYVYNKIDVCSIEEARRGRASSAASALPLPCLVEGCSRGYAGVLALGNLCAGPCRYLQRWRHRSWSLHSGVALHLSGRTSLAGVWATPSPLVHCTAKTPFGTGRAPRTALERCAADVDATANTPDSLPRGEWVPCEA